MTPEYWKPSNPSLRAACQRVIEISERPREKNPLRRGQRMKMWDYMDMSGDPKTREAGRRIRARLDADSEEQSSPIDL